jgi:hypothetical protein
LVPQRAPGASTANGPRIACAASQASAWAWSSGRTVNQGGGSGTAPASAASRVVWWPVAGSGTCRVYHHRPGLPAKPARSGMPASQAASPLRTERCGSQAT